MSDVIDILMRRDELTEAEAQDMVQETVQMMEDVEYDPMESEDIFLEMLGLEPDYIMDVLFG